MNDVVHFVFSLPLFQVFNRVIASALNIFIYSKTDIIYSSFSRANRMMTTSSPSSSTFITEDDKFVVARIPVEGASGPVIRFHNQRDLPWGCLSNFYPAPIVINNKSYATSEHFFQAMKFFNRDSDLVEKIRSAESPGVAAEIGRDRSHPIRKDWETVKEQIMFHALLAKFSQHPLLLYALMQTKYTMIVEWHHSDKYWASGADFLEGKNRLGVLLMQLRELFRFSAGGLMIEQENQIAAAVKLSADPENCPNLPAGLEHVRQRIAEIVATTKERPFFAGKNSGCVTRVKGVPIYDVKMAKHFKDGHLSGVVVDEKLDETAHLMNGFL